ncbi:MAG: hypothetical protein QOG62_236 [Thermoleophilaceae bacterium]|jgi:mannose-6-phosphate isomerase-like protein (cupin superfamily)|nr:hypothetical protein [Thermoleophilaceae bacterium]
MEVAHGPDLPQFTTKDGSSVRELAHPRSSAAAALSVAEAVVAAGAQTDEHLHRSSEEVYIFISGRGRMRLGAEEAEVQAGDAVVIPAGTPHKLWAADSGPLVLLCACCPPYSDEDTVLTGG